MERTIEILNQPFNEKAWIKLIFLLSDTWDRLNELVNGAVMQLPMKNRKRQSRTESRALFFRCPAAAAKKMPGNVLNSGRTASRIYSGHQLGLS